MQHTTSCANTADVKSQAYASFKRHAHAGFWDSSTGQLGTALVILLLEKAQLLCVGPLCTTVHTKLCRGAEILWFKQLICKAERHDSCGQATQCTAHRACP